MRAWPSLVLILAALVPGGSAAAQVAQQRGPVAFFASQRIAGQWEKSYFGSIPQGPVSYNACEEALDRSLVSQGFATMAPTYTDAQRVEARRLGTVFKRYNDVSAMPNDTAVRAASVVSREAPVVVACRAVNDKPRWHWRRDHGKCVAARCKAVDTRTRRSIAMVAGKRCAEQATPEGRVEAVQQVCTEMGSQLGERIAIR